jgi:NhaP-type Na+/H+ or K+/H+ antiporter
MTAYLSYLMGDVLGLSGILSLFVSAIAISHYALHNISGALGPVLPQPPLHCWPTR